MGGLRHARPGRPRPAGVTTIVDMPLNCDPADHHGRGAGGQAGGRRGPGRCVDVGFWGGAVPGNVADLAPLHEAGVFGFKCFLLDSGVRGVPATSTPAEFAAAMAETARLGALHDRARRGRPT